MKSNITTRDAEWQVLTQMNNFLIRFEDNLKSQDLTTLAIKHEIPITVLKHDRDMIRATGNHRWENYIQQVSKMTTNDLVFKCAYSDSAIAMRVAKSAVDRRAQ